MISRIAILIIEEERTEERGHAEYARVVMSANSIVSLLLHTPHFGVEGKQTHCETATGVVLIGM